MMPDWVSAVLAAEGFIIRQMSWSTFLFMILFVILIFFIYRLQTDPNNTYDLRDLLLDEHTNKASVTNHILLAMAIMAIWVVVTLVNKDKEVTELVLGVLGIFVAGKAVKQVFGQNPSSPPSNEEQK